MSSRRSAAPVRYAGRDELDQAAARLWQAVRARHPELPATAPEINASYPAEPFPQTAAAVATSVLREAVRALADVREVSVVSRGGRYHNRAFRDLARELGLVAEGDSAARGFAEVSLAPAAAEGYREEIEALARVLRAHPVPASEPSPTPSRASGPKVLAECGCPRKIYAAAATLAGPEIVCSQCGAPFRAPAASESPRGSR